MFRKVHCNIFVIFFRQGYGKIETYNIYAKHDKNRRYIDGKKD